MLLVMVINQLLKKSSTITTTTTTTTTSGVGARSLLLLSSSSSSSSSSSLFMNRRQTATAAAAAATTKRTIMSTTTTDNNDDENNNKVQYVFDPPSIPSLPIVGDSNKRFPIHRIYCVGRNYIDHVKEMGGNPKSSNPTFFTKPSDSIVESGSIIQYKNIQSTNNLHYEVELVVAIHKRKQDNDNDDDDGGNQQIIPVDDAYKYIFGYGVGIDLTKRDLQSKAKSSGSPWDTSKSFDYSAPISSITPVFNNIDTDDSVGGGDSNSNNNNIDVLSMLYNKSITLELNGKIKQNAKLNDMIYNVSEIISELSKYFILQSGDIIFTGTPSGVGQIKPGDHIKGKIDGFNDIEITII